MKVLLINFTDAGGGAAIAAVRLVNALNEHGVYARLGVVDKKTANPYVFELPRKKHSVMFKIYHKCTGYLEKIFNPFITSLLIFEEFSAIPAVNIIASHPFNST